MSEAPAARILIVDDEAAHMKALCATLRDQGYQVAGHVSGPQALEALKGERFDLMLADLVMPGMDGIELLKAARDRDPDLVGVIMTGEGTIATAVEAMRAGALDYILKPFKLGTMLPVLARALAMRRLRIENSELQQHLRARAAELEAAYKELESFSYSVSHDLRGPLRAISSYCQLIEKELGTALGERQRLLFNVITSSSRKMGALIDDLLAFSKLSRVPVNARPTEMSQLVAEVWAELQSQFGGAAAEFNLGHLPPAVADPALLKQVWSNLLSNAWKYSSKRERPCVAVGAGASGSEIVYRVKDNGVGFDMRHASKLFTAFQRLHGEAEFPGTGVGLAIVHRIVTRHGGRVWVEAVPDRGATFYFSLPASPGGNAGGTDA